MPGSKAFSNDVRVVVESEFVPERSDPDEDEWLFVYRVQITNEGSDTLQLLTRHWIITDANGNVHEVRGDGVVGEQPVLAPGQSYVYSSACPLATPFGTMQGSYQFVTPSGELREAEIAPFALADPLTLN